MRIDEWINGCKVEGFPWVDGKYYYLNVRYFKPGSSINNPVWDKSVYITRNEKCDKMLRNYLYTIVDYICNKDFSKVPKNNKFVITF
jgi:hypothetical protein